MKRIAVMSNNCTPCELITKYYRILTDLFFVNFIVYLNCFYFFIGIDREAADTGQLCLFVDNLFDSANGNVIKPTPGKDLRSAVTLTSPHWVFWSKALDVLRSMKYETTKKIPSIANWITTIQGLQLICKRLLKAGFKYILLRNFNQDPIENFFGSIRSHGLRNINPTPANFISSFKSLVINNFTSTHSVGANCEADDSDGILDNLKDFLFNEIPLNEENEDEENCSAQHGALTTFPTLEQTGSLINSGSRSYVSGWIIKKIKKITKNCTVCISKLSTPKILKEHFIIQARQYIDCNLLYPDQDTIDLYSFIIQLFNSNFHKFVFKNNGFNEFLSLISKCAPIDNFKCSNHDLSNMFLKTACKLLTYSYINNINRILNKGEKSNTLDPIKQSAILYNNKYSKKKKVLLRQNVNYL